ncbi:MAG: VanW family protein [Eubacteriales bacterium]|nr:VanW family protein [Eubacteriales bacterium]
MGNLETRRRFGSEEKRLIINEEGEFAEPADLSKTMGGRIFAPLEPETGEEQAFVFDDEPRWSDTVTSLGVKTDVRKTQAPRPLPSPKPAKTRKPVRKPRDDGKKGFWRAYLYVGVITLCFLCMCILVVVMMPQMAGYFWKDFDNYAFINGELLRYDAKTTALYKQYKDYLAKDVIYPGLFVDAVSVGDMTVEEARAVLTEAGSAAPIDFSVTIAIGDQTWTLDPSNIPASRDLGNVLERAYAIGRSNTVDIQATQRTPFRERLDTAVALRENGINLTTQASYDHEAVQKIVDEITAYVTRDPVNAEIQSFDYKTRTFSFTEDQPGVTLDPVLLYDRVTAALDRWEKNATVTAEPIITQAQVTKETLTANFNLVAAYTTETTSSSNRNTNIDLACQAINGTALMPGETFSFNEKTGQRTTDKGYQSAGAIAAGQSIEEVGGGICQVSSTIFNAVARANLQVVERSPHAWPSTYVNRGEDATVNWPNLDFKFKNNTDYPVFLITYYENRKMSAEIWGMSLGDGVSIDLYSEVIKTMEPTTEVKYVLNTELPYGTTKISVKPRTGYVVETYKVWYLNGQETKRELMQTSTYRAYQQVVEYNN